MLCCCISKWSRDKRLEMNRFVACCPCYCVLAATAPHSAVCLYCLTIVDGRGRTIVHNRVVRVIFGGALTRTQSEVWRRVTYCFWCFGGFCKCRWLRQTITKYVCWVLREKENTKFINWNDNLWMNNIYMSRIFKQRKLPNRGSANNNWNRNIPGRLLVDLRDTCRIVKTKQN